MRPFPIFFLIAVGGGLVFARVGGAANSERTGPEVVESDDAGTLNALLKFSRNSRSALAVRASTAVMLPMHEGDFSCAETGEYGSLGGLKWVKPYETGVFIPPEHASILGRIKYVLIGRGCRACIYNEMSGEVATKPVLESEKERLKNWRFLPCGELLDKLRSIGLAESSVRRFAKILELAPNGDPVKRETQKDSAKERRP